MSKYDITDDMNLWDYSMYNMHQQRQERVDALIKKYGFPVNERNLLKEDYAEYDLLKDDLKAMEKDKSAIYSLLDGSSLNDEDRNKNGSRATDSTEQRRKETD